MAATPEQIAKVRRTVDELESTNYSDDVISDYYDERGFAGTVAAIWEEKAASAATLVDVSEAGASHKFSDIAKNAREMSTYWSRKAAEELVVVTASSSGSPRVRKIVRE